MATLFFKFQVGDVVYVKEQRFPYEVVQFQQVKNHNFYSLKQLGSEIVLHDEKDLLTVGEYQQILYQERQVEIQKIKFEINNL